CARRHFWSGYVVHRFDVW
nr:immunoglobulin heavy chain junction region [Macaca mulatta]